MDPVTRYASDVCSGAIVAGRFVRLACQRHLDDLEHAAKKGLVWRPDKAQLAIEFFAEVLCLPEKTKDPDDLEDDDPYADPAAPQPFLLQPWQQFIVGSLEGWYTAMGMLRVRSADIETGKGSGKSPLGAGILLKRFITSGVRGGQYFTAATKMDQAKIAYTDAESMVDASPALKQRVRKTVNNLALKETRSFLRPISSEKKGLDGKRVQGVLVDELQEQPDDVVVEKMRANIKGRPNALLLMLRNSGYNRMSVAWTQREYSRQVLEGLIPDETRFAYICQLDPCEACQRKGADQPSESCPDCDDWRVEGPHWLKANPNLGVSLPWEELRQQVMEASGMPAKQNTVRRLNFCIWTQQSDRAIDMELWAQNHIHAIVESEYRGRTCHGGLDLAGVSDLTAWAMGFECPLDPDAIDLILRFWVPEALLVRGKNRDLYQQWVKDGYLETTPGDAIDYAFIRARVLDDAAAFNLIDLNIDRLFQGQQLAGELQDAGLTVVAMGQGFVSYAAPMVTFFRLLHGRKFHHGNNPILRWNADNLVVVTDPAGNMKPDKQHSLEKIDGISSSVMALDRFGRESVAEDPDLVVV